MKPEYWPLIGTTMGVVNFVGLVLIGVKLWRHDLRAARNSDEITLAKGYARQASATADKVVETQTAVAADLLRAADDSRHGLAAVGVVTLPTVTTIATRSVPRPPGG